jgi:hypothetical protein
MKNLEIETILTEIISREERYSDALKELPSYYNFIKNISDNYSNNELEALQYLCEELGRNIQYDVLPSKSIKEYRIGVENTRDDRKNNIKIRVYYSKMLKLSNRDVCIESSQLRTETTTIPFYKYKYESVEPIYLKIDEICSRFEIANKEEIEDEIAEYTKVKREI